MKDNVVFGGNTQTPTNAAVGRYPQSVRKNVNNIGNNRITGETGNGSIKQNNVQSALQNMMHRK